MYGTKHKQVVYVYLFTCLHSAGLCSDQLLVVCGVPKQLKAVKFVLADQLCNILITWSKT